LTIEGMALGSILSRLRSLSGRFYAVRRAPNFAYSTLPRRAASLERAGGFSCGGHA
jgi:hypothetical protein